MKIQILGSAAAEGWPALFCECEACKKARINGGKDIRRRCCYLIDDDTMVDFGPDVYAQSLAFNIDLAKVKHIFFTHSHCDHLAPIELSWRHPGFSRLVDSEPLRIYGNQAVMDTIHNYFNAKQWTMDELQCAPIKLVKPGDVVKDGELTATAFLADHSAPPEIPLNYIIQRGNTTILIANDTGWWCEENWKAVEKFKIDIAIIECTFGVSLPPHKDKHLGAEHSVAFRDELQKRGALKDDAIVAVNHFSHNCHDLHEDFERYFNPKGILVGYDGMIIER